MVNYYSNKIVFSNCNKDTRSKIESIFEGIYQIKKSYSEIPFYDKLMKFNIHYKIENIHKFGTDSIDVCDVSNELEDIEESDDSNNISISILCDSDLYPCLGLTEMIVKLFDVHAVHDYYNPDIKVGGKCIMGENNYENDCLSYIEYLKKYNYNEFLNYFKYILELLYNNNKEYMIANEEFSEYATIINSI